MTDLTQRITSIEAELAIRNVIASYGLAADCGDVDAALACHTADAIYIVSDPNSGRERSTDADLALKGHAAIAAMLNSERHQSLLPNCAHTVGPLVVEVAEDSAKVTGYSRVYNSIGGHPRLMRVAFNHWEMRKDIGTWKIARRVSRLMGEDAAQVLLKNSLT